jgi:hypothetical protein
MLNSAPNQTGLAIDEIAWNYTLRMANVRYDEATEFCYSLYTNQRVADARWILPAAYAVAAILSKALYKKHGHIESVVFNPEGVMEAAGIHSRWAVNRFHKRLRRAVESHRPKE